METPKGKKGVDEVLEQLFSYGTSSLDRINFQKALDEIGAQESAGSDFSLKVLADYFERGCSSSPITSSIRSCRRTTSGS